MFNVRLRSFWFNYSAVFQRLANDQFCKRNRCIVITVREVFLFLGLRFSWSTFIKYFYAGKRISWCSHKKVKTLFICTVLKSPRIMLADLFDFLISVQIFALKSPRIILADLFDFAHFCPDFCVYLLKHCICLHIAWWIVIHMALISWRPSDLVPW